MSEVSTKVRIPTPGVTENVNKALKGWKLSLGETS